jgi:hypothetical protein
MYTERLNDYKSLEQSRNSKLLVYITGDRPHMETQIHQEVFDFFGDHLDTFNFPEKISLFLYSRGGNTLAGWSIVHLIRQFCKEFEVIIPSKALSTATIICLGANNILMTKQATLGPIDPSVNTPLNPQISGAGPQARVPVSVEAMKGYIELAKNEFGLKGKDQLSEVLLKLSDKVHPLVLGEAYRARTQIKFLAQSLISQSQQVTDKEKIDKITAFLCSESGSHDYTINRREARDNLGLKIEKPDDDLYALIKKIFSDIRSELALNSPYNPNSLLGQDTEVNYSLHRSLIESVSNGSHCFTSEGVLRKTQVQIQPGVMKDAINDQRTFEGWRHYGNQ